MEQEVFIRMIYKINKKDAKKKIHRISGRFAFLLQREIIKRVPRRFVNRISVNERNGVWTIGTNDEIFKFWEKGTKAHDIRPQMSKTLKFEWPNAPPELPASLDGFYYFKKVRHPGTKGHEVIKEIVEDKSLIRKLIKDAIRTA